MPQQKLKNAGVGSLPLLQWIFPTKESNRGLLHYRQILYHLSYKEALRAELSCVQLFATPWTVARQAPLSMEFSREEYWSGLRCPPPGDLLDPGMEPRSPAVQADSLPSEPPGKPLLRLKMPKFTNFLLEISIRQGQSLSFLITLCKNFSKSKYI